MNMKWDVVVSYMDDDIREVLHSELAPCTQQDFFRAYVAAHKNRFGEDFWIDEDEIDFDD